MKTVSAVVLCAALGFVAAGCAGTRTISKGKTGTVVRSKVSDGLITVSGTVTISNVKTGTVVRCRGEQLTETVPGLSEEVVSGGQLSVAANGKRTRPQDMRVTRSQGGMVTVSCTR
jgi:hypothetical protein